jgi:esterase/lipase
MQNFFHQVLRTVFGILEFIAPRLVKRWAVTLFFTPLRFKRPHRERGFVKKALAAQNNLDFDSRKLYAQGPGAGGTLNRRFNDDKFKTSYRSYQIGQGKPVLLVHGWSGRGSQLGDIAVALANKGFKAVTFDAFAHGESPGKQTTVLEFIEIIKDMDKRYGPFEAIIGHSLGGIAAGKAISNGMKTKALITIGSPTTFKFLLDQFGEIINASAATMAYVKNFTENYIQKSGAEFSLANLGEVINVPGLIFHDRDDKEASFEQAALFADSWKQGKFIPSSGLGHSRILRDENTIAQICDFVECVKSIEPKKVSSKVLV